jgi:hypothetical protein
MPHTIPGGDMPYVGAMRMIELTLGLPPMSQHDAAAMPIYGAMQLTANPAAFVHLAPRISLDERTIRWRMAPTPPPW